MFIKIGEIKFPQGRGQHCFVLAGQRYLGHGRLTTVGQQYVVIDRVDASLDRFEDRQEILMDQDHVILCMINRVEDLVR